MFRNYFRAAWRNLMKNKVFSFINIIGLSIGMAACLLILQYVSFELSYDQFNEQRCRHLSGVERPVPGWQTGAARYHHVFRHWQSNAG
jgi:hypothetical protein